VHVAAELMGGLQLDDLRLDERLTLLARQRLPDESLRAAAERQARDALGEDAFDDAVDADRALDPDDTVGYALRTSSSAAAS
jgi:hypothetical protein